MTTAESKLNDALQRRFESFERTQLPKLIRTTISQANDSSRLRVLDVLTEYAKKDNTISKARINALLRELQSVESELRTQVERALRQAIRTTAEQAAYNANQSILGALGVALAPLVGVSTAAVVAQQGAKLADIIGGTAVAFGVTFATIVKSAVDYVFKRIGEDSKTLTDRVWYYAGSLRDKLASVIRNEALKGRTVDDIMRQVKTVYSGEEWKLRRLVQNEAMTTYRKAVADGAQRSAVVAGLKIVDHPDGHAHHETHECYVYARADEYGMGRGVYPTTETKLLMPHIQCTSTLHYVLAEGAVDTDA